MAEGEQEKVAFHYIKSNAFRVIFVNGATGSVAPDGRHIRMAVYNDRLPIPIQEFRAVNPDGTLGQPEAVTTRQGIVREVEGDLVFSISGAKSIAAWLTERVAEAEDIAKKLAEKGKEV